MSTVTDIVIRNFNQQTKCADFEDLLQKLKEHYLGMSISVQYRKPNGFLQVVFLDVPSKPAEKIFNTSKNWQYLSQAS